MRTKRVRVIAVSGLLLSVAALLLGCGAPLIGAGDSQALRFSANSGNGVANTISVNGTGIAVGTPDVADVQLGVESSGTDAAEVIAENTTKMDAVMEALKGLGIEDRDVQTVAYSMWVEQVYDPQHGRPTGEMRYFVANQVRVRVRDLDMTGRLLEVALSAGANTVQGISFSLEDPEALQRVARAEALQNARAKAEELAAGLNVRLGRVQQVSEYSSGAAPVMMDTMVRLEQQAAQVPIAPGSYNVTVDVQLVFEIAY